MTVEDCNLLSAVVRLDLAAFIEKAFPAVTNEPLLFNWHIERIAWHLEQVKLGKTKRLIINIPPRYGKSQFTSVAFVAWMLGHFPSKKILCCSYNMELATKFSSDTQTVMKSRWYRSAFPKTVLNPFRTNKTKFETTKGGFRQCCSTEGGVIGHGGSLIIVDDPMSVTQAYSPTERKRVHDFFDKTLYSRLDDKQNGAIIVVMQRQHVDDLTAHLLEQGGWTHLRLPALTIVEEKYFMGETQPFIRQPGRPLHEAREPKEELDKIRKSMGSIDFDAQYQQAPSFSGQSFVKWEWFKTYDKEKDFVPAFEYRIQSWDTAAKIGDTNDYSVCTTWGVAGDKSYLLNVVRVKLEFPALKKLIQTEAMKADAIFVEDASSGTGLIQQLRNDGLYVITSSAKDDKVGRLIGQSGKLEAGLVFIPSQASWLEAFKNELMQFPAGKHDDQVDSMSQFLVGRNSIVNMLKTNPQVRKHLHAKKHSGFHKLW